MDAVVCTLFEGSYHYGLGVLTNSLARNGYKGVIWVGYRGNLPSWMNGLSKENNYQKYKVSDDLEMNLVLLQTDAHLTNYKPDFILDIFNHYDKNATRIFYFDPDIVIKTKWENFEKWSKYGVFLSEDVNSPLNKFHPLRYAWIEYFGKYDLRLEAKEDIYVNGGFIGISKSDIEFLLLWQKIQVYMAMELKGLKEWGIKDRTFLFHMTDQDALNCTIMAYKGNKTIMGKDAMDIIPGGYFMSHALGGRKPWRNKYIKNALSGISPLKTDRLFWKYAKEGPINVYSRLYIKRKNIELLIGIFLSRFIKR